MHKNKIYWISRAQDISRTSWFTNRALKTLLEKYEITVFTPERKAQHSIQWEGGSFLIKNIHQLPHYCSKQADAVLIYNLEDDGYYSSLCRYFLEHYPGMCLLHDTSFFYSEISKYSHGSGAEVLNTRCKEYYGPNAIELGTQMILNKSLDIYSNFYLFLEKLDGICPRFIVFGKKNMTGLEGVLKNISYLDLEFAEPKRIEKLPPDRNRRVLIIHKSNLSCAAREFETVRRNLGVTKSAHYLIEYSDHKIQTLIETKPDLINLSQIDAVIELGNHQRKGISELSYMAAESGSMLLIQSNLEMSERPEGPLKFYASKDSLATLFENIEQNATCTRFSFEINFEGAMEKFSKLIEDSKSACLNSLRIKLNQRFEILQKYCENEVSKRIEVGHDVPEILELDFQKNYNDAVNELISG